MYDLIILGIIPGTHIQISFETWRHIALGCAAVLLAWRVHRSHIIRDSFIAGFAMLEMRRKTHVIEAS